MSDFSRDTTFHHPFVERGQKAMGLGWVVAGLTLIVGAAWSIVRENKAYIRGKDDQRTIEEEKNFPDF